MLFACQINIEEYHVELCVFCKIVDFNTAGTLTNEINVR